MVRIAFNRRSALFLLLLGVVISFAGGAQSQIYFSDPVNVSNTPGGSALARVAAVDDNVYVTWADSTPGDIAIFFARSTDHGQTFSPPVNLSENSGASQFHALAVQDDRVYAAWIADTPGNFDVFFSSSADRGETFSEPANISHNPGRSVGSPQIAASGERVYVTWSDNTPGRTLAALVFSADGGETFSEPVYLDTPGSAAFPPQLAVAGDNVYVVWQDSAPSNDVILAVSHDGGESFGASINLSDNAGVSLEPRIVATGPYVYVAWQDDSPGNYEILLRRSGDGGKTFDAAVNLSDNPTRSFGPELVAADENVYVAWYDFAPERPMSSDILFARSTDRGATFSRPVNLSGTGAASAPILSALDRDVYVTWVDRTPGEAGLFLVFSTGAGLDFSAPVRVVDTPTLAQQWAIERNIYLVWSQLLPDGQSEIFFVRGQLCDPPAR